jgi:GNAT superfamily N-acetyltransferase
VVPVDRGYALVSDLQSRFVPALDHPWRYRISSRVLDELEACYRSRSASVAIELCSASAPALVELLADRGYHVTGSSDVLVHSLFKSTHRVQPSDFTVRRAGSNELGAWAQVVAAGFARPDPEAAFFLTACGASSCAAPLLAESQNHLLGGALLASHDKVTWLFGSSTLPAARGRGVQSALIENALNNARTSGARFAAAEAEPETSSHRNFTRLGFTVLYHRFEFLRPFDPQHHSP